MILVILPLGKEARQVRDWVLRVIMYTAASTVGAALLALGLGLVGQGLHDLGLLPAVLGHDDRLPKDARRRVVGARRCGQEQTGQDHEESKLHVQAHFPTRRFARDRPCSAAATIFGDANATRRHS